MSPAIYPLLFVVALIAGLIDSMAGGGGLITVPVLLNLGIPVPLALGTNKFQASFGSCSATWHYYRAGAFRPRELGLAVIMTLSGSLFGAWCVKSLSTDLLSRLIPFLLLGIFVYVATRPSLGTRAAQAKVSASVFWPAAGLMIGFYDGFLGPGTGTFWIIAIVLLLGHDFVRATAETKLVNATSNVAALLVFALAGQVDYVAGGIMAVGQLIGSRLGTRFVLTRGAKFVRPLFLVVVGATILRLLYVTWFRN